MGVFVGDESDLKDEKLMYGNDFAYIGEDTDNFVPIVSKYLHKQIINS